jgi:hypothetical protein
MVMQRIVPTGAMISELEKKAADCEEKAKQHAEPEAAKCEGRGAAIPGVDRGAAIWHMAFVAPRWL